MASLIKKICTRVKEKLKTGDVLHCRGRRWISRIIMWATKSEWSHTALFAMIEGHACVIEAQKNGVNIKTWDNWVDEYGYTFVVHRNPFLGSERAFLYRALSKAGVTGYDLVSLLIRYPWKIITGSWRKMSNEDDKMVCSEYVAWSHRLNYWWQTTPDELYNFCVENEWEEIKQEDDTE